MSQDLFWPLGIQPCVSSLASALQTELTFSRERGTLQVAVRPSELPGYLELRVSTQPALAVATVVNTMGAPRVATLLWQCRA